MPYDITTRDGITIRNIPDEVDPNAAELQEKVKRTRAFRDNPETLIPGYTPPQPRQEPTFGEKLYGAGEAGLGLVSGLTTGAAQFVPAAMEGLVGEMTAGRYGTQQGAENVEQRASRYAQAGTYQPRSEVGRQYLQGIMEKMASLPAYVPVLGEMGVAGSLQRRAATDRVQAMPQTPGPMPLERGNIITRQGPKKQQIAESLAKGDYTPETVGWQAEQKAPGTIPRVVKNKAERVAVDNGWDIRMVGPLKGMNKPDRAAAWQMLKRKEMELNDPLLAVDARPGAILGDIVMKDVKVLRDVNAKARMKLDKVAERLKGNEADIETPFNDFIARLEKDGVTWDGAELNFDRSIYSTFPALRGALNKVVKQYEIYAGNDAFDAHQFKRALRNLVDYRKSKEKLTADVENNIKTLAHDINENLRAISAEYKDVNTRISETKSVLDQFQDAMGKKRNLYSSSADEAVGQEMRKLLTNYQKRTNIDDALMSIDDLVKKYGKPSEQRKNNVKALTLFVNELDRRLKPSARGSIQGIMNQEATRIPTSTYEAAMELGRKGVEKVRGGEYKRAMKELKADKKALQAMRDLLKEGLK